MHSVKRIVLDVLKPHQPNALNFAAAIADSGSYYRVSLKVAEVDEKTETIVVTIEGKKIDFDGVDKIISELGGSIHSIDEVVVEGKPES